MALAGSGAGPSLCPLSPGLSPYALPMPCPVLAYRMVLARYAKSVVLCDGQYWCSGVILPARTYLCSLTSGLFPYELPMQCPVLTQRMMRSVCMLAMRSPVLSYNKLVLPYALAKRCPVLT
eukprot:403113-Rhodomonas_salina.2